MFSLLLCFIVFVIILRVNKQKLSYNYKILNPISILVYVWMLVFFCHFYYWGNDTVSNLSYLMCTLGVLFMSLGFWLTFSNGKKYKTNSNIIYNQVFINKILILLLIVELFRLVFYTYIIVYKLAGGVWGTLIADGTYLRRTYLEYDYSFLGTLISFSTNLLGYIGYVVLAIYFSRKYKKRWFYIISIGLIEMALSIITMSKLSFSLFILTIFITYLNSMPTVKEQKKKLRKLVPLGVIILLSFFLFVGFQRNYMETKGGLQSGVLDGIIDYFGGPLAALELVLQNGVDITRVENGMIDIGRTETNVYTMFFYFHRALPYIGFVVFSFILGSFTGKIYRPWKNSFFSDVSIAWISVILAFSFFDFLLKFTVYQVLFFVVWFIDKKYHKKLYVYE